MQDRNGLISKSFRQHSLLFYSRIYDKEETASIFSPVSYRGESPVFNVIGSGELVVENPNDPLCPRHVKKEGGNIFKGDLCPGLYSLTALEETRYSCLSFWDYSVSPEVNSKITDPTLKVKGFFVEGDSVITIGYDRTDLLVCMFGKVLVTNESGEEVTLEISDSYYLKEGDILRVKSADGERGAIGFPMNR